MAFLKWGLTTHQFWNSEQSPTNHIKKQLLIAWDSRKVERKALRGTGMDQDSWVRTTIHHEPPTAPRICQRMSPPSLSRKNIENERMLLKCELNFEGEQRTSLSSFWKLQLQLWQNISGYASRICQTSLFEAWELIMVTKKNKQKNN